jgi:hypothetical protein
VSPSPLSSPRDPSPSLSSSCIGRVLEWMNRGDSESKVVR